MTRSQILLRNQDVLAGLLFLVIAGIVAWGAHHLPMGSGVRMGPGMFPMILCGLMAFLGLLTLVEGLRSATPENATAPLAWGRMLVICGSGVFFALTLAPLGLPAAIFGTVLIAASASRQFRLVPGLGLAALAAVVGWLIFAEALGLPFRLVGPWLQFGGAA